MMASGVVSDRLLELLRLWKIEASWEAFAARVESHARARDYADSLRRDKERYPLGSKTVRAADDETERLRQLMLDKLNEVGEMRQRVADECPDLLMHFYQVSIPDKSYTPRDRAEAISRILNALESSEESSMSDKRKERCATCHWWNKEWRRGYESDVSLNAGECENTAMESRDVPAGGAYLRFGYDVDDQGLFTGPEFGCALWRAKRPELEGEIEAGGRFVSQGRRNWPEGSRVTVVFLMPYKDTHQITVRDDEGREYYCLEQEFRRTFARA